MNKDRGALGLVLGGLLALVGSSVSVAPAPAAHLGTAVSGLVAFQSDRDRNLEIYVVNTDGTQPRNLTSHLAGDIHPTWSPDGTWIAFSSNRSGDWQLYVMRVGARATRLFSSKGSDVNPTWSPDGTKIAFEASRGADWDIHVIDVKIVGSKVVAGGERNLTKSPTADDRDPSWAPDSAKLVFTTTAKTKVNWNLAIVDDKPRPTQRLLLATKADEFRASWAQSGRIFFSRFDGVNYDIFWTTEQAARPERLTSHAAEDADPDASTSGLSVAFSTLRAGNYDVWVMTSDGANQAPLTRTKGNDLDPVWQPGAERPRALATVAPGRMLLRAAACPPSGIYRGGTTGVDTYTGTDCNDELHGAGSADILTGKKGADRLYGEAGADDIYARDGIVDTTVSGGDGSDCARLDSSDPASSIETKKYSDTAYC